jgi:transglutaminase-like putative cysteine protease
MTDLLERPEVVRRAQARPGQADDARRSLGIAEAARVAALVIAAILPFGRVFVTRDWLPPVLAAGILPVALLWGLRRLRAPWWVALPAVAVGWLWYAAVVLLPSTLWQGVVPTQNTARVAAEAAVLAIQRIAVVPAPVYPEIPLLLLAITGVWWVACSIAVLSLRLGAPGKAIICATTLWLVPLAIVPEGGAPWALSAPLLFCSVLVILAEADRDALRWGRVVAPTGPRRTRAQRQPAGLLLAVCAVLVGAVLAGLLPGFGDPPWYQLRAQAATTLTDNPIVQLRTNLVAQDRGPILRVRSPEPVYLRSTALDQYSETEEWTASGIEPRRLQRGFVPGGNFTAQRKEVRVEVVNLTNAVLVPAPTGPIYFRGPRNVRPLYDPRTSTFTFGDSKLQTGHRYSVIASTPEINAEVAATVDTPAPPELTRLPEQLPDEVRRLARKIVDDADATTSFAQALAIQNELRTWEYSLEPPAGHSGVAMRTFLEQRIGYCEQFAGTMAVMLRTLGIPSRVAVGFTPGTVSPDDPTLWTVTWANAHAWVEVRFGGEWIAFEPTPRTDGNVLVPTATDLAPARTVRAPDTTADLSSVTPGEQFDIFDEREALQSRAERIEAQGGEAVGGAGGVSRRFTDPAFVVLIGVLLVAAPAMLVWLGRRGAADSSPRSRILTVRERVGRIGHGIGLPPPAWETDQEYLGRLAGNSEAARALATACTRARYAPDCPAALAERAEKAGEELLRTLIGDRPAWQRQLIRVRGDATAGWQHLRRRRQSPVEARQRSSSSRLRRSWK